MADERDPPLGRHGARLGLGDVVQQRPETQRPAAGHVVRKRRREQLPHGARVIAERRLRVALERDRLGQHGTRVLIDVEVVKAALLDPPQRHELGQDHVGDGGGIHHVEAVERPVGHQQPGQLGEHALGRDALQALRTGAGERDRVGLDGESELAREPRQAQRPQRVALKAVGRDRAQPARAQVSEPAGGIDERPVAAEPLGDRVDGQVSPQQIGFDRLCIERLQVDLPRRARARRSARRRTHPRARTSTPMSRGRGPARRA